MAKAGDRHAEREQRAHRRIDAEFSRAERAAQDQLPAELRAAADDARGGNRARVARGAPRLCRSKAFGNRFCRHGDNYNRQNDALLEAVYADLMLITRRPHPTTMDRTRLFDRDKSVTVRAANERDHLGNFAVHDHAAQHRHRAVFAFADGFRHAITVLAQRQRNLMPMIRANHVDRHEARDEAPFDHHPYIITDRKTGAVRQQIEILFRSVATLEIVTANRKASKKARKAANKRCWRVTSTSLTVPIAVFRMRRKKISSCQQHRIGG